MIRRGAPGKGAGLVLVGVVTAALLSAGTARATLSPPTLHGIPNTGDPPGPYPPVNPGSPGTPSTPIRHIVFIHKENRSFDEYFGALPGVDGATTAMNGSQVVALGVTPDPLSSDINHDVSSFLAAYDGGLMDGFAREPGAIQNGVDVAYTQMSQSQIPGYWTYAQTYGIGDRYYPAWKGASYANRMFEITGQGGEDDSSFGNRIVTGNPNSTTVRHMVRWGCDGTIDQEVVLGRYNGSGNSLSRPCFAFPSLADLLTQYGMSWRLYADNDHFDHVGLDSIASVRFDPTKWANVRPLSQFTADLSGQGLPAFSWVISKNDEHAPGSACQGEDETESFVNGIMNSADWPSTVIVITWDEWGGFYDHVPPPQVDNVSYGIRAPLLVISPFTKVGSLANGGEVSHTFYSSPSILRLVEDAFSLPTLGALDNTANDMMDLFDWSANRPALVLSPAACSSKSTTAAGPTATAASSPTGGSDD